MGLDSQSLRFLLRNNGISFESFLMLGRQVRAVSLRELERQLRKSKFPVEKLEEASEAIRSSRFIEPILSLLGAHQIDSLDFSDYEKATIVHDMNTPIPQGLKNKYSCVFDGGTLEHVFNFPQGIKNAMEMVAVGGHFLGAGPVNNLPGHGFYQFSPETYWRIFSEPNGFSVEEMVVCETRAGSPLYNIDDPERVRQRVEFTNSRPAYLMIRARRLRLAPIFETLPQQSDYVSTWSESRSGNGSKASDERGGLRGLAKQVLPEPIKRTLRPFFPKVRALRFSGFRRV